MFKIITSHPIGLRTLATREAAVALIVGFHIADETDADRLIIEMSATLPAPRMGD